MPPVRCHQHWSVHSYSDRMLRGLGQLGQAPGGRINYQLSDGCCRAAQLTAHSSPAMVMESSQFISTQCSESGYPIHS